MFIVKYSGFWEKKLIYVLEIVDCQGHLAYVNKKDGRLICNQFLNNSKEIDPEKQLLDILMFYGDLNVQL